MNEPRSTTAIPVRKRAKVHAMVVLEIEGETDEEIAERFADAIAAAHDHVEGIRDVTVQTSETFATPFVVPAGAERWACLAAMRFGEDLAKAPEHDGSWWWTNGYAAYRCDGPRPEGLKAIGGGNPFEKCGYSEPQRATTWGPPVRNGDGNGDGNVLRVSSVEDELALQACYIEPVERAYPNARWTCGPPRTVCRAYDGDRIVAFVMPCTKVKP